MSQPERRLQVLDAFRRIFGRDWTGAAEGPPASALDGLRDAFRTRAFSVHPDRATVLGRSAVELASELRAVVEANRVLVQHLSDSRLGLPVSVPAAVVGETPDPSPGQRLYRGLVPRRKLMFGEFLYYSAWISRRELNDAVEWQRASRPKFGELAIELGLLTERQLLALLRQTPGRVPLGKRAVARRAITDAQREGVLAAQRKLQRPIGCYFVESAILLSTDVRRLAQRQVEHNQRVRTAA